MILSENSRVQNCIISVLLVIEGGNYSCIKQKEGNIPRSYQ